MKPIVIGVSGGSGSGKTTVVGKIIKALGHDKVTIVAQDYYYFDRSDVPVAQRADINSDANSGSGGNITGEPPG